MLIESSKPLTVRTPSGEVHLTPGQPVEMSEEDGRKLLVKAKGKVRLVERADTVVIESEPNAKGVYFYRESTGNIHGPAQVDFVYRAGEGPSAEYWLFITYDEMPTAINAIQLRRKREFDTQVRLKPVELIRGPK